jgi:hypothetical protein
MQWLVPWRRFTGIRDFTPGFYSTGKMAGGAAMRYLPTHGSVLARTLYDPFAILSGDDHHIPKHTEITSNTGNLPLPPDPAIAT